MMFALNAEFISLSLLFYQMALLRFVNNIFPNQSKNTSSCGKYSQKQNNLWQQLQTIMHKANDLTT